MILEVIDQGRLETRTNREVEWVESPMHIRFGREEES